MEIFSEIYNCYYQIMKSILQNSSPLTLSEIQTQVEEAGYEESFLYLIPKLTSGEWNLLKQDGDLFLSKLSEDFYVPLTELQRSYLKTILQDKRIQLFFTTEERKALQKLFSDIAPLWKPEDIYYYDCFSNGDDYSSPLYQQQFQTLLTAIKQKQYVDISYEAKNHRRVHHHYLPCRLEYSVKNDKFRLLGITVSKTHHGSLEILNLDRMQEVNLLPKYEPKLPDISQILRSTYYKEPARLLIHTDRNALERAMLQFANYEKNTIKIDENTYECLIYYNQKTETELLIEVLSFGPMIEVLGNDRFLELVKARLRRQKRISHMSK